MNHRQWKFGKKKGSNQDHLIAKIRSSKSYLNKQPGFNKIDLNQKGNITSIALLKNGSCFQNKPIYVPGLDKILLNNTCAADSILSILAISTIESNAYNLFLNEKVKSKDQTAEFVLKMIGTKPRKTMYMDRVYLLCMHYTEMKNLIGDIHLIDTVDTASSMIGNLLTDMPSYERIISCSNDLCFEPEAINQGIIISLNAFDGDIDLQEEMNNFFETSERLCVATNCGETRKVVMKPKEHIIIELLSVPRGEYYL